MSPSPTFLESLKPQERYELLQKARDPSFAGESSRATSRPASSLSRGRPSGRTSQRKGASTATPGKRLRPKGAKRGSSRGTQGNSFVFSPASTRQGGFSARQCSKQRHGAEALDSSVQAVLQEQGNNEQGDVSIRFAQGTTQMRTQDLENLAETLSKDNTALASEVMQLRSMLAAEKENGCVLGDRVDKLQDMYVESFVDQGSLHTTRQSALNAKLEALATPEVLALTRPPATFPVPVPHEQQSSNPSALQVDKLRRQLVATQALLEQAVKERENFRVALEDSQAKRKAEKAAYQKQASVLSSKMLGTMRRLVYAADQISKKDVSINSMSEYIHRLEEQALLLRKASNTAHGRTARRCHSQDTRTVRKQTRSSDSVGSPGCKVPKARLPSAGSQIRRVPSCTRKGTLCTRKGELSSHDRALAQLLGTDDRQHLASRHTTHGQLGEIAYASPTRTPSKLDTAGASDTRTPESDVRPCRLIDAVSSRDSRSDSPINKSYALQHQHNREVRQQGGSGGAVCCSRDGSPHGSPGLTPVVEGRVSVGAWQSPSVVSAGGSDLYERPSMDMFGGTFGTRPDFTAGAQVRSTADSETWKLYMTAIDEMEQRINALDFPSDIDSNLIAT